MRELEVGECGEFGDLLGLRCQDPKDRDNYQIMRLNLILSIADQAAHKHSQAQEKRLLPVILDQRPPNRKIGSPS